MLSDEEWKAIEEQYKEGLVKLSNVIEPLINQFKTDYSLDIQQCRLIINYLLMERDFNEDYYDELDKEIEELKQEKEYLNCIIQSDNDNYINKDKIEAKIEEKFLEAKGLHERGVQPQAQYTMKLLRDLEKSLLEKED